MTVQYRSSGSNMKAVKTSVWRVFYRAFMVPPSQDADRRWSGQL